MDVPGQSHTWGIPGPTFLSIFLVIAALLLAGTLVHRAVSFSGRRPENPGRLHPLQVAWLNGGDHLAIYAALGALRVAGALGSQADHRLVQTGPLPAWATRLEWAVYQAAGQGRRSRELIGDPGVRYALTELRAELERAGLALPPTARTAARVGPILLLVLLGVGVLRLVAGIANHKPVGFLLLTLACLAAASIVLLVRVPRGTRAARTALRTLRDQQPHLSPEYLPAYATYGPAATALGIALFGGAVLYALDPVFAAEAEIRRTVASGAHTSTAGSSSGGSGGGDPGDSCGGGCGGGGCGGGGCGG